MAPKPKLDHSAGVAGIARVLHAAIDGKALNADSLEFACRATGIDFALAVYAMAQAGLVAFNCDKLVLGPLGRALVLSAYIEG